MKTNLVLAPGDLHEYADRIDEALVGVMVADGPNIAPLGSREVDGALTESIWNDEEGGRGNVRLLTDNDIPAQWVAVEAGDASLLEALVEAVGSVLPVQNYETLYAAAVTGMQGRLSRLALTHDNRLVDDLPALLREALSSMDVRIREDAAMAAHIAGVRGVEETLRAALKQETDSGVQAMLEHAIEGLETATKNHPSG